MIPSGIMTNIQIEQISGYKTGDVTNYGNISEYDKRKGVIINLDAKGPGSHWCAIKKLRDGEYVYYDSYGMRPPYSLVKGALVHYNPIQHQRFDEEDCGKRCILWLNRLNYTYNKAR